MILASIVTVLCIGTTFGNIICQVDTRSAKDSVLCTAIVDKPSTNVIVPTDHYEARDALIMSNCHVKSFTIQPFIKFTHIKELDLSANLLETLVFDMFANLTQLVTLDLSNNKLTQIINDNAFIFLTNLRNLDLSNNRLDIQWFIFRHLNNLMTLDLSKTIGANPIYLNIDSLTALSLSGTTFFSFGHTKLELKNLVHLDLSFMQSLRFYSDHIMTRELEECTNLIHLNISGVALKQLSLKNHEKLEVLDASHNSLRVIHWKTFENNFKLKDLDLSWNDISTLEQDIFTNNKYLVRLNLEGNKIDYKGLPSFSKLLELETLIFSNNKIERLDENFLDNLSDLAELYLNGNQIKKISNKQFKRNTKLIVLDLGNNKLTEFDPTVIKSDHLLFLYLDNNRLRTISQDIVHKENLIGLFLHCNDIAFVPQKTFEVSEQSLLKTVTIYGNPWTCECLNGILASKKNIDYIQNQFTDGKSAFCLSRSSPEGCTPAITHSEMYYWRMNRGNGCQRDFL